MMSEPLLSIELHLALTGVELLSLNQEISGVGFPKKSHGRTNSWSYWKRKNFSAFRNHLKLNFKSILIRRKNPSQKLANQISI